MPRHRLVATCLLAATLLVAACSSSDGASAPTTPAPGTGDTPEVTVRGATHSPIAAAIRVTADEPVTVSVQASSGDHVVTTPATAQASTEQTIPLVGLRAERTYDLEVTAVTTGGEALDPVTATFTTGSLPYPLPDFEVSVDTDRAQPGITLVEYNPSEPVDEGGQPLIGIDHEGEVVYWYRNTASIGAVQPTAEGTFLSQYFPVGVREFDLLGNVVGNWQVAPEPSDESVELRNADALAAAAEAFAGNPDDPEPVPVDPDWVNLTSFHHEATEMPDGNILALATTNHEITEAQRERFCPGDPKDFAITSDVIVEFQRDGTVVRTWDLWDVLDIDEVPGSALCSTDQFFESRDFRDWTHSNAVTYDPDRDAVIVSVRHTDQVVALDHLDATGPQSSVRWILGNHGTLPLEGEPPHHQHAVELQDDGSLLLYDNGNLRPGTTPGDPVDPTYSRAVLYEIDDHADDPSEWSATQTWEHRIDDIDGEPLYAYFLGDADRLDNGDVLIDHGGIRVEGDTDRATIIEVVPDGSAGGDIVWELQLGVDSEPVTVYQVERLPSLYFGPRWDNG